MSQFANGTKGVIKIGGTPIVTLPTAKWTMTIKGNTRDVSNARDGRKRIVGLVDADLDFELPYDAAADPTLAANGGLQHGIVIAATMYKDGGATPANAYSGSFIVDEIGVATEIDGEMRIPIKALLESGTITYPAA